MSFDWTCYISLANDLINTVERQANDTKSKDQQEAYLRSALSRSYYGVFCIARNLITESGVSLPEKDIHKFVREMYLDAPDPAVNKIGEYLKRLLGGRLEADYENDITIDATEARKSNKTAFRAAKGLKKLKSESLFDVKTLFDAKI